MMRELFHPLLVFFATLMTGIAAKDGAYLWVGASVVVIGSVWYRERVNY